MGHGVKPRIHALFIFASQYRDESNQWARAADMTGIDCIDGPDHPHRFDPDAAMFRLIVENAGDMIVRGDAAGNRTYVSPSYREILGYEPGEVLGNHAYQLVHPDDLAHVSAVFGRIGPDMPSADLQFRMRRKDGTYLWIGARYRHLPDQGGVVAILRDIDARKIAEERLREAHEELKTAHRALRELADRDGLTGLANRRRFDELLASEFRRAQRQELPLGLVLLDVDHFKAYNDTYGHLAGDECLRRVGRAIQGAISRPGDHVARYGGEEIAALLPATDLAGAVRMADRMREAVIGLGLRHIRTDYGVTTVSAGASAFLPMGVGGNPLDLINAADRALYQAKAEGRNRVCARSAAVGMMVP